MQSPLEKHQSTATRIFFWLPPLEWKPIHFVSGGFQAFFQTCAHAPWLKHIVHFVAPLKGTAAMRSAPVLTPWHHEMKQSVRGRVKEQVLGRTGASWEDRLQEQKAKKVQAMKTIEKEQREAIKAATEKGIEKQQVYSPLLALRSAPLASFAEKQAQRQEERVKDMEDKVRSYHITRGQILEKMRTREPLFLFPELAPLFDVFCFFGVPLFSANQAKRCFFAGVRVFKPRFRTEDVSAAKTALAEARRKRQAELQAEEKKRWEHLEECAAKGCQKRQTLHLGDFPAIRFLSFFLCWSLVGVSI